MNRAIQTAVRAARCRQAPGRAATVTASAGQTRSPGGEEKLLMVQTSAATASLRPTGSEGRDSTNAPRVRQAWIASQAVWNPQSQFSIWASEKTRAAEATL